MKTTHPVSPLLFNLDGEDDEMQDEIWRPVVGYEGLYEVSNMGRIRSVSRTDDANHYRPSKILSPYKNTTGYRTVNLCGKLLSKNKSLHTIVAEAFLGPRPEKLVVDHIDNNPLNNRLDNLQYISQRLNSSKDRKRKHNLPTGVCKRGARYLAVIQVCGNRKRLGSFSNPEEAGDAYKTFVDMLDNLGSHVRMRSVITEK